MYIVVSLLGVQLFLGKAKQLHTAVLGLICCIKRREDQPYFTGKMLFQADYNNQLILL